MPINTETLNRQLYKRLSKYKPKPLDAEGNVTPVEDEADVFKFTFSKDGEDYGTVFATIDDNHALTVYYSDDVTESPAGSTPDIGYDDSWTGLLKQLKSWAMHNQLSWKLKDRSHLEGDMARRNHMNKKDKISEGYHAMGKSRSYSDNIPSVKIVIEHSRQIEEGEQRYRNINKIFLENQMGERFLLDTKKPGIARVYARHIAEGGKVNDERWNHIQGLCEEYQKMAGFVRATRNGQFNESAQKLVNEAINHYQGLRESLSRMTGKRGYEAYFESWTPPLMEDDTDTSNLNELFVQETLDPRIESVMPILSKLQKNLGEMKEVSALAEWADSLLEGGDGGEASEEPVDGDMGNNTFGGEDGNDAPKDDLSEEESLTSNNPIGIPEGMLDTVKKVGSKVFDKLGGGSEEDLLKDLQKKAGIPSRAQHGKPNMAKPKDEEVDESALQAYLGDKKYGKDGMDALRKAGQEHASEKKMQNIRAKFSDKEKVAEVDLGQYDAVKTPLKGKDTGDWDKNFREKLRQYGDELEQRQKEKSEKTDEGLDANQKRVGQLGPTEKVKNNNIGKLVGTNENFIGMSPQAVAEGLSSEQRSRLDDLISQYRDATDPIGYDDDAPDPDEVINQIRQEFGDKIADTLEQGPSSHFKRHNHSIGYDPLDSYGSTKRITKLGKVNKQDILALKNRIKQRDVTEGQDDLDAIKRLLGK